MVTQAVGLAVEVDDHGTVQQAVEYGCCDGGVAEDLGPKRLPPVVVMTMLVLNSVGRRAETAPKPLRPVAAGSPVRRSPSRVGPGAFVLLADYVFHGYDEQRKAIDALVRDLAVHVCRASHPTGLDSNAPGNRKGPWGYGPRMHANVTLGSPRTASRIVSARSRSRPFNIRTTSWSSRPRSTTTIKTLGTACVPLVARMGDSACPVGGTHSATALAMGLL